ncbi:DUF6929 family protein [Desertivirga arenae]|uniref:DUF6929 family protein n=1 Tax=Desertivirga arenae TaxID=2810309 RepID=UPI001A97076B|nr:hypothetical protein [Pedobacter sp. SYSU D00823]
MKIFSFIIVLLILISCNRGPSVERLKAITGTLLKVEDINYPSGSSLTFDQDSLYLMGDDARELLILDTAFTVKKSIVLFPGKSSRQRKSFKADIEAGDFLQSENKKELFLISSGSVSPYRDTLFKFNLRSRKFDKTSLLPLYSIITKKGVAEVNIEGAAFVKNYLFLANRSNLSQKRNYLIRLENKISLTSQQPIKVIPLALTDSTLGISGLDYYRKKDMMFITLSSEATASASADGKIGNGALAIITDISKKADSDSLSINGFLPFTAIDPVFKNIKIESVAVGGRVKGGFIIYLVADNDDGRSILYKVRLKF